LTQGRAASHEKSTRCDFKSGEKLQLDTRSAGPRQTLRFRPQSGARRGPAKIGGGELAFDATGIENKQHWPRRPRLPGLSWLVVGRAFARLAWALQKVGSTSVYIRNKTMAALDIGGVLDALSLLAANPVVSPAAATVLSGAIPELRGALFREGRFDLGAAWRGDSAGWPGRRRGAAP
jgi:hypothetical protein